MGPDKLERFALWLAVAVCLLFTASLRDLSDAALAARPAAAQPPVGIGEPDAVLLLSVVDQDGQAAQDVIVRVFAMTADRAHLAATATTGPDGNVSMKELPRGEAWVIAHREGLERSSTRLVLQGGERKLALELRSAEQFEVVVVDGLQRPIRGVHVSLFGADPLPYMSLTDHRGLALLTGLGPPPYAVEVNAMGFGRKLVSRLTLDDSPLFIKLNALGRLELEVRDPEGRPAAGATVLVAGSSLWPARSATTDATGHVSISGLERGFYDVRAEKGTLISDTETGVLLETGETKQLKLGLVPGAHVRVLVHDGPDPDAKPVNDADVALVEGGISSFPRYGRTDGKGVVVLGPIVGSHATVSVQAKGFVPRSAVALEEGQTEIKVVLLKGGVLVGRVVDDRDYPIDGARLEVVGVDLDGMPIVESSNFMGFREAHFAFVLPGATPLIPAGELGVMPVVPDIPQQASALVVGKSERGRISWVSRGDGHFTLSPVTPGSVRIVAHHPRYVEALSEAVQLAPGGRAEIKLVMRRGGMLEGRILEHNRQPVAGARVEVVALVGTDERVTYSADDGTFAFAALGKEVILSVARPDAPEHVVSRLPLTIEEDSRREIEVVLPEPRASVTFRVTDDRGYPIDRVQLHVASLEPDMPLRKTLFTNDAGEALLFDARGLQLRVLASRRGKAPLVVQLEHALAEVVLALQQPLSLIGRVVSREGGIGGATVTLLTATGARHGKTDAEGNFVIDDLTAGLGRLMVVAKGFVTHERELTLADRGHQRPVDAGRIELSRGGAVEGLVVDEEGKPVAGAHVAAGRVPTYLPMGKLPLGVVATNRKGRFVLRDLAAADELLIEAFKVGHGRDASEAIKIRVGETTKDVRIVLREDPEATSDIFKAAASLAVTLSEAPGGIIFAHVPLGGEAQRAGILPGDLLLAVDGVSVRSLGHARRRLTGPLSQDMVLRLARPPNARWGVRIRRERLRR